MADLTPEEIKHHVKTYVLVFVALAFLTIVTVGISYLDLGLGGLGGSGLDCRQC